jgi:hypothetical protein
MKHLDPISEFPEYEVPDNSCQIQARWPDLVVGARRSALSSEHRGFFEFAPLPGGSYLVGAGYERANPDGPSFVREQILGQLTAGFNLGESVRNVLGKSDDCEVAYVQFDPVGDTLRLCGIGSNVSAIHVTAGGVRLVHGGFGVAGDKPQPFNLRPGEALVLLAHPGIWGRHLVVALDHLLLTDLDGLHESSALALCGRLDSLLEGSGLCSVTIFRSNSTANVPWVPSQVPEISAEAFETLDMELTPLDLQLLTDHVGCFAM